MASRGSLESIPLHPPHLHPSRPLPKKRKTCHTPGDWASQTISIRPHAASLSDAHFVLEPITIVPRSHLPLTWLDFSSTLLPQAQPGSLFVADIPVLEADDLHGELVVLAVRLASDNALYVVERVKRGVYALSKLVHGVDEGDVLVAVKGWHPSPAAAAVSLLSDEEVVAEDRWWCAARIDEPGVVAPPPFSTKRTQFDVAVVFGTVTADAGGDVRMEDVGSVETVPTVVPPRLMAQRSSSSDVLMPAAPGMSAPVPAMATAVVMGGPPGDVFDATPSVPAVPPTEEDNDALKSPQEMLDHVREQYLHTLYVSKTSVAYFAKGPLARCRAAFQSPESESSKPSDLIEYYREAILTAKKMDLKYRESVQSTIQDAMLTVSDDERTTRPKKTRKKKMGKNGLYPQEEQFIRKWWKDRSLTDQGVPVEASREAEVKKHVADLRMRETQLQILLILETLALEASASSDEGKNSTTSAEKPEEKPQKKPAKDAKSKKAQDMAVMLELHLDRLCIWHAVTFDDTATPDPTKAYHNHHMTGKKDDSDAIRDFCTEVIIPFYAARLPDKCKKITRKLGVSAAISPFPKKTSRGEPGASVERLPSQKHHRRSLHRVATDEKTTSQNKRPSMPSLNRSNTAPSQVGKKDSLEPLLPMLTTSVRGGIQNTSRVDTREVDLDAMARQHQSKLKKVQMMASQKKELDAAIDALRKPNRQLVARDIAEDADKRRTGGSARKPKNPVRNPLGQGVQVAATPRGSRKKDAAAFDLPPVQQSLSRSFTQPRGNGSSLFGGDGSPQMVPGSASFSGTPSARDAGVIQETPTRRPSKPLAAFQDPPSSSASFPSGNLFRVPRRPAPRPSADPSAVPSTPVTSRHADAFAQPSVPLGKPITSLSLVTETPPRHTASTGGAMSQAVNPMTTAVMGTPPVKKRPRQEAEATGPVVPVTPEKSIYAELGWDDDELGM